MVLTRAEVESDIRGKGDFVQIDHLKRFLLKADNTDVKKFVLLKLAAIHEIHNFLGDAARNIDSAAEIALNEKEKKDLFMKEAELLVKSEQFDLADKTFLKALSYATIREKPEMQTMYLELYRVFGAQLDKEGKQRKALGVYHKLYSLNQPLDKRLEVKQKIMNLYYAMGNLAEYNRLKDRQEVPQQARKEEPADIMDEIGVKRWDKWGLSRR